MSYYTADIKCKACGELHFTAYEAQCCCDPYCNNNNYQCGELNAANQLDWS